MIVLFWIVALYGSAYAALAVIILTLAIGHVIASKIRHRRLDREWAAGVAWRLHVLEVRDQLRIRAEEAAMLERLYAAESAEESS